MKGSDYKKRQRKRHASLGEPPPKKNKRNPVKVSQWNWRAKLTNIDIPTT